MKILKTICLFLFLSLINCKTKNRLGSLDLKKQQDSLAFELCQIYGLDQGIRRSKGFPGKMKMIQKIDSFNFKRILDFVKINGIPSKKNLGEKNINQECVEGAMIAVLLHNPHILVNNKNYLDIFIKESRMGNLKKEYLATILDKYYWVRRDEFGNRKLLYGSQFGKPCKKYKKKSDSVRAIIGLEPLLDSLFIDCKTQK